MTECAIHFPSWSFVQKPATGDSVPLRPFTHNLCQPDPLTTPLRLYEKEAGTGTTIEGLTVETGPLGHPRLPFFSFDTPLGAPGYAALRKIPRQKASAIWKETSTITRFQT